MQIFFDRKIDLSFSVNQTRESSKNQFAEILSLEQTYPTFHFLSLINRTLAQYFRGFNQAKPKLPHFSPY